MLTVEEARRSILSRSTPLQPTVEALMSSVLGLVLAEDIRSDIDSPPFDKAMMDGYALRSEDAAAPTRLQIVETIRAGSTPTMPIGPGQCARIMTGAPIPTGADAVIKHESTTMIDDGHVQLNLPVRPGENVLRRGEEMQAGEVVLSRGTVLRPQEFGLLAAVGKTAVDVFPPPRISIISTGDELVEANMKPMGGQIRNSNGPMLVMQSVRAGALPRYLGIARDRVDVLRSLIREGLDSNVLILSGGVSAGDYDLVPKILQDMGVESHFHKVAMKPGKPFYFGTWKDTLIFGLPGNPVSSFVGFELFVRPAIETLRGVPTVGPHKVELPLTEAFHHRSDRETYYPARRLEHGVQPTKWFGSADLRGLSRADVLAIFPAGEHHFAPGHIVPVIALEHHV